MAKYRNNLPQIYDELFLSPGGLETILIFEKGLKLPEFASFTLLQTPEGISVLTDYFDRYVSIATLNGFGLVLESPTWRASSKWGERLGFTREDLDLINRRAIQLLTGLRERYESDTLKVVISGCIGPKGDAYVIDEKQTVDEAQQYHTEQIATFAHTDADLVTAFTLAYTDEAIGMVLAAREANMPIVIGFTLETDGKLPSGESIKEAIEKVDNITDQYVAYYMINCVHPSHFDKIIESDGSWLVRIRSVRVNASSKSHAELDDSDSLDDGNPYELGQQYMRLKNKLVNLNVVGGCCGTDHRHAGQICKFMPGKQS